MGQKSLTKSIWVKCSHCIQQSGFWPTLYVNSAPLLHVLHSVNFVIQNRIMYTVFHHSNQNCSVLCIIITVTMFTYHIFSLYTVPFCTTYKEAEKLISTMFLFLLTLSLSLFSFFFFEYIQNYLPVFI